MKLMVYLAGGKNYIVLAESLREFVQELKEREWISLDLVGGDQAEIQSRNVSAVQAVDG